MVQMHTARLTEIAQAAAAAVQATAAEVLDVAQDLVPVDSGELRDSGELVVSDGGVRVVFTAGHAWYQHERLDYQHDDGGAKFVERAVDQVDIAAAVADGVRARLP